MPSIVIVDFGTQMQAAGLMAAAAAIQRGLEEDFFPGWRTDSTVARALPTTVRAAQAGTAPAAGEWLLGLYPDPDRANVLGYHDKTAAGQPIMKVYPWLAEDDGVDWTVDAFHEVVEALVDPELERWATLPDGRTLAYEVCDAVEADAYDKGGVKLSNFVLPAYFSPHPIAAGTRLDLLGRLQRQGEVRPGGYNQVLEKGKVHLVQGASTGRRFKHERRGWRTPRRQAKHPGFDKSGNS